jgi:hypothetical protein
MYGLNPYGIYLILSYCQISNPDRPRYLGTHLRPMNNRYHSPQKDRIFQWYLKSEFQNHCLRMHLSLASRTHKQEHLHGQRNVF